MEMIKKFFKLEERGTTIRTEVIGGLVTFLAMVYIVGVNPGMLSDGALWSPFLPGGVFVATALAAGGATILMGLFANYPIALASGMGINAIVAFTLIGNPGFGFGYGFSWQEALAVVLVSGIIFLVISLTPIRKWIINAVPHSLKKAIGAGIGFFIAFVGLQNAGIIVPNDATAVALGDFADPAVLLALFGIVLVVVLYSVRHKISKFALILAMIGTAVVGVVAGLLGVAGMPSFGAFDYSPLADFGETATGVWSGLGTIWSNPSLWIALFTLVYIDIFDTAGTLIAVSGPAGLLNEKGELENVDRAMLVDAVGTTFGAMVGTSTVTSYIESSAGIEAGARTGLSSVVVGLLFLATIALFPVFNIFINFSALTSMALVLVGVLMFVQIKDIDWADTPVIIGSFLTIIVMMLAYSIGTGIAFGFIFYVVSMMVQKRFKEVNPVMYVLAAAFVVYFTVSAIF